MQMKGEVMPSINSEQLAAAMLLAAQGVFAEKWPSVRNFAEREFRDLASEIANIATQTAQKLMSEEKARLHLNMQKNNARIAMYALQGLSVLTVEAAINAALEAVKPTVNRALGFRLL